MTSSRLQVVAVLVLVLATAAQCTAFWPFDRSGDALAPADAEQEPIPEPEPVELSQEDRDWIAQHKATCPFIGSLVKSGRLTIYGSKESPRAKVDDIVDSGNTGGGHLGNLLFVFATGNHAFHQKSAESTSLDTKTALGYFSLDFPGSQGSHYGHSGILMGSHLKLNSGRWSEQDWLRLVAHKTEYQGKSYLRISDVDKFIAENLRRDPKSYLGLWNVIKAAGRFVITTGPALVQHAKNFKKHQVEEKERESLIALTKTLGDNNLIGSSGEFGLLMAFFAHSPHTVEIDGDMAVSLEEVSELFHFRFPVGWESWPKRILDWSVHTSALAWAAQKEYRRLGD